MPFQLDFVTAMVMIPPKSRRVRVGVPTINLIVPVRHTHAHNGIMNRDDFDGLVKILVDVLQHLDGNTVKELRSFD